MELDLSSLRKAVNSLERAVKVASVIINGVVDTDQEEVIRAGVIQTFEFTYELSWKFMKRWMEQNVGGATLDGTVRKELFRKAFENGLIDDVDNWMEYHEARNETSHTYDNGKAEEVLKVAINFLKDAKLLLSTLENKND